MANENKREHPETSPSPPDEEYHEINTVDLLSYSAVGMFLAAASIFVWQFYSYLKYGDWPPVSVITVLTALEVQWAIRGDSWYGLYSILAKIPFAVALVVGSFILFAVANSVAEKD